MSEIDLSKNYLYEISERSWLKLFVNYEKSALEKLTKQLAYWNLKEKAWKLIKQLFNEVPFKSS